MTAEAPEVDVEPELPAGSPSRQQPVPLSSLTAAAARVTGTNFKRFAKGKNKTDRQAEACEMYHAVGELRFLANTLGARAGQARIFVGALSDDPLGDPTPLRNPADELQEGEEPLTDADRAAWDAFTAFGNSPQQLAQMITRAVINLFVPGDGWFVGTPPWVEAELNPPPTASDAPLIQGPAPAGAPADDGELDLTTLKWRYLSTAEVEFATTGEEVTIKADDTDRGKWTGHPDKILMFRCWRPDPFEYWQADSPTLSALPILRQIVDLTQAVSASLDSRLAGAGILFVPQSAEDAVRSKAGPQATQQQEPGSPFVEAIIEAAVASIQDRDSAARVVPLVFTVPDATIELFKHMTFSSPLDEEYEKLEEKKIRRLALALDADPEVLLGMGGLNHWGAWLVQEDTVTTHLAPPVAVVCDAFTTQFLWPVLEAGGMDPEVARQYVVWFSVEHLIVRPNRFADAREVHAAGGLSDAALRKYGGFDDDDAPEEIDPALKLALHWCSQAPSLAESPGLPALVEQIRAAMSGDEPQPATAEQAAAAAAPDGVPVEEPAQEVSGPPDTDEQPAEIAASGLRQDGWLIPPSAPVDGRIPPEVSPV